LQDAFINVFNRLKEDKESFIETLAKNIEKVLSKRAGNTKLDEVDKQIEAIKEEFKGLIRLQTKGQMDEEVYNEEYVRLSGELEKLRHEKADAEKGIFSIEQYKQRVDEIVYTINAQDCVLSEFDDNIFNALVDRIGILEPTHFVFVLKNGMRVEG